MRIHIPLTVLLSIITWMNAILAAEPTWTYIVPAQTPPMGLPSWRLLVTTKTRPADIHLEVSLPRNTSYIQLRYGQNNLNRVVMALSPEATGDMTLYVDLNRNRKLESREKLVLNDGVCQIPLSVSQTSQDPRILLCKFSPMLGTVKVRTGGYMQGTVTLNGQQIMSRRIDTNANGQYADHQDRIWLDLNQDGNWDALNEQFTVQPILTCMQGRYAVKADRAGTSLGFKKLEGTGTLVMSPTSAHETTRIQSITASLAGEGGGAFALRGQGNTITVPTGKYRVYSFTVVAKSDQHTKPWEFVFNNEGGRPLRWFELKPNTRIKIDPSDKLTIAAPGLPATCHPGQMLSIKPVVFTADGLRLNACTHHNTETEATVAHIELRSAQGKPLASRSSGFA